jgi:hypothetical protein
MSICNSSTVRAAIAGAIIGASALLSPVASASSAPYIGPSSTTPQYEAFGNTITTRGLGDCMLVADANLTRRAWPNAPITTQQVALDYNAYYDSLGGVGYLEDLGYDGHFATRFTPVHSRAAIIRAANSTGAYAVVMGGEHAVAIIAASSETITITTWGRVFKMTWAQWRTWNVTTIDAIKWGPAGDVTLTYETNVGDLSAPRRSVAETGTSTTLALEPPNSAPGVSFEGWSTSPLGTGTLYQPGQAFVLSSNTILWAQWSA